jgi:hypothetical protein
MNAPRFPHVHVQLSGEDGNAFFIIGRVGRALREAGVSNEDRDAFANEAMSGNYDNVLQTVMRWVSWS